MNNKKRGVVRESRPFGRLFLRVKAKGFKTVTDTDMKGFNFIRKLRLKGKGFKTVTK